MKPVALYFLLFQLAISSLIFPAAASKNKTKTHYSGGRVVGGSLVNKSYPFIVKIELQTPSLRWIHQCTGSMLTEKVVLTACHCLTTSVKADPGESPLFDPRLMRVRVGITEATDFQNGQVMGVESLEPHPQCHNDFVNDVGVLILAGELQLTPSVQTLFVFSRDVGEANAELRRLEEMNVRCYSQGWGSTSGPKSDYSPAVHLKQSRPKLLTSEQCSARCCQQPDTNLRYCCRRDVDELHQICTIDEHSTNCFGDSGTALICNGFVFGVASNLFFGPRNSCVVGSPFFFSDVEPVLYFVNKYWR